MKISANNFKPKVRGKSDKFSWNLYRLLKEWEDDVSVIRIGWNFLDGQCSLDRGQLYICRDPKSGDFLSGNEIHQIMGQGPSKAHVAIGMMSKTPWWKHEWEDVTEWFFREYADKGRCLIVPNWSHEWIEINSNARKCKHCGQHQRREVYTKRKLERVEAWA